MDPFTKSLNRYNYFYFYKIYYIFPDLVKLFLICDKLRQFFILCLKLLEEGLPRIKRNVNLNLAHIPPLAIIKIDRSDLQT